MTAFGDAIDDYDAKVRTIKDVVTAVKTNVRNLRTKSLNDDAALVVARAEVADLTAKLQVMTSLMDPAFIVSAIARMKTSTLCNCR